MDIERQRHLRRKWLSALRSGKYKNVSVPGYMRLGDTFDALGVLCDVLANEVGGKWNSSGWRGGMDFVTADECESRALPKSVCALVGLRDREGSWSKSQSLTDLIDRGASHKEIAKFIELEPVGLFAN